MANGTDGTDLEFEDRFKFDQPGERKNAFFELLHVSPQVFRSAVDLAIAHAEAADADPQAERWTPLGPRNVGGSIRSIAQHPNTPTTLYAGSAQGGLWKTENDGYTWRQIGGAQLLLPIGALAIAPSDPRVLYVGTGEAVFNTVEGRGIFRTRDGGEKFERLAPAAPAGGNGAANFYTRIMVDPNEPKRCWFGSETGLWRLEPNDSIVLEGLPAGSQVTDVVLAPDPGNARQYILLAGIQGVGIERGVFNRDTKTTAWTPAVGAGLPPAGSIARVRLAFSRTQPVVAPRPWAYAVFEDAGFSAATATGFPTVVLQSTDFGVTWPARGAAVSPNPPPGTLAGQAFFSLVIEVDPLNVNRVLVGYVDLHLSIDGGLTWNTVLDWRLYDNGDRAQHADFHALAFDVRGPRRQVWACNDGGISFTADMFTNQPPPAVPVGFVPAPVPQPVWRKKSYGIACAQFVDFTTHPVFPFIVGGGMQDNGTFLSYGGQTWYRLLGGDGGALALDPADPRRFFPTTQGGVNLANVVAPGAPPHPRNSAILPDVAPPANVMVPQRARIRFPTNAAGAEIHGPVFIAVIEGDPVTPNLLLIGRQNATYYTTDGVNVGLLNIAAFGGDASALAFSTGAAPRHMWIGTTTGLVFNQTAALPSPVAATPPAGTAPVAVGPAWNNVSPPAGGNPIAGIAVHPLNNAVVAVSTWGTPGAVFLTHDRGANWQAITGAGATALPPGQYPCVAFDPTNTQVLFVGTVAGVYVARDLPARPAGTAVVPATNPRWRTYSLGLPFVLVNDMHVSPVTNTLRVATYGRGVYEANIRGVTPAAFQVNAVQLSIRTHVADDARTYAPANTFFTDPRMPPVGAPADFDYSHAIDIRVDSPSFVRSEAFRFGELIDGSEFDETLVPDRPLVGDTNFVYVQVQNRGSQVANNVQVFLYFADAGNAAPPVAPPITADINYPNTPAPACKWQLVGPVQEIGELHPGQPVVMKFDWIPPLEIANNAALLALCTNGQDAFAGPIPVGPVINFVKAQARAALHITGINRDAVYIRDGVDDDGNRGSVAWGGRSPDIIVTQGAPVANPDDPAGVFKALDDARANDRVRAGANLIYVRVFNRTQVAINANVRVFQVPPANSAVGPAWTLIGGTVPVAAIPPRGWKFAGPIAWAVPADPDPGNPDKGLALMAIANVTDGAGVELDPFPERNDIAGFANFWRFFLSAPLANNAALRALRFTP